MLSIVLAAALACDPTVAVLTPPDAAPVTLRVELAASPDERARGLMLRREVPAGTGMLFVYPRPQPVAFWMKNTLVPLDMLFFDAEGRLAHVQARAIPGDLTALPGAAPDDPAPARLLVLEIAGGEAARLGLKPGTRLAHAALDPACPPLPVR